MTDEGEGVNKCEKLRDAALTSLEAGLEALTGQDLEPRRTRRKPSKSRNSSTQKDGQAQVKRQISLAITVSPHKPKNLSKVVGFCTDLQDVSEEETEGGLSDVREVSARIQW